LACGKILAKVKNFDCQTEKIYATRAKFFDRLEGEFEKIGGGDLVLSEEQKANLQIEQGNEKVGMSQSLSDSLNGQKL